MDRSLKAAGAAFILGVSLVSPAASQDQNWTRDFTVAKQPKVRIEAEELVKHFRRGHLPRGYFDVSHYENSISMLFVFSENYRGALFSALSVPFTPKGTSPGSGAPGA